VQYAHARTCKILRDAVSLGLSTSNADFSKLGTLESKLAQTIVRLPEIVQIAARDFTPQVVVQYCLDLAAHWNSYYNHKDANGKNDTRILDSDSGLREARLALAEKVKDTLAEALALLGIEAPQEM
jgi:arginyl-tRNA synthetase